ncbi:MAG: hypothetical protein AAF368_18930, partial [Planctomycetota bacterium]
NININMRKIPTTLTVQAAMLLLLGLRAAQHKVQRASTEKAPTTDPLLSPTQHDPATGGFRTERVKYFWKTIQSTPSTTQHESLPQITVSELWVFPSGSGAQRVSSSGFIAQRDLKAEGWGARFRLGQFGLASVRVPGGLAQLRLEIESIGQCADLQVFLTRDRIETGLRVGGDWAQLDLTGGANDLGRHFGTNEYPLASDLTARAREFYTANDLPPRAPVFVNLLCPFWAVSSQPKGFDLELSFARAVRGQIARLLEESPPNQDNEQDIIQRSEEKLKEIVKNGSVSTVLLLESYYTTTVHRPEDVAFHEETYGKGNVMRVSRSELTADPSGRRTRR